MTLVLALQITVAVLAVAFIGLSLGALFTRAAAQSDADLYRLTDGGGDA